MSYSYIQQCFNFLYYFSSSPVYEWWRDLGLWCEPECMTYLQSKPIRKSSGSTNANEYEQMITNDYAVNGTVEALRKFQKTARAVKVTFGSLNK